jgi:hypothetical protein
MTQFSTPSDSDYSSGSSSATPTLQATPDYPALVQQMHAEMMRMSQRLQVLESSPSMPGQSLKVKLPEPFSGDRQDFIGFLAQLEMVFSLRPQDYQNDLTKIITFGTLLRGKALTWFLPLQESARTNSLSWSAFVTRAKSTFGDPCLVMNSEAKLMRLVHRGPLADYISEFTAIAFDVQWHQRELIAHFKRGLDPKILSSLVGRSYSTLDELIALSTEFDHEHAQIREMEKLRNSAPSRRQSKVDHVAPSSSPARAPDAMDLDASRRGPLTTSERDRRFRERLCLYCGHGDHMISACPTRPKRSLNASSVVTPGPGKVDDQ